LELANCCFQNDNVLDLSHADNRFDVLIARAFYRVAGSRTRVAEMHRVLRPVDAVSSPNRVTPFGVDPSFCDVGIGANNHFNMVIVSQARPGFSLHAK